MAQGDQKKGKEGKNEEVREDLSRGHVPQDEAARLSEAEESAATEISQTSPLPRPSIPGEEGPVEHVDNVEVPPKKNDQGYWKLVGRQFRKNRPAVFGAVIIALIALVALFADFLANDMPIVCKYQGEVYFPVVQDYFGDIRLSEDQGWKDLEYDWAVWPPVPYASSNNDLDYSFAAPFSEGDHSHVLGTDQLGRDLLAGIIHGARISLLIGIVAMGIATIIGVLFGALAGYFGGWVDMVISRLIELFLNFPVFFLIITIVAFYQDQEPESLIFMIMTVIGLTGWMGIARLTRGEVLRVRNQEYVTAAGALGFPSSRVILRHVLPNSLAPVLVAIAFGIASAILTEAALSFLGFGVPPTIVTWGSMLSEARGNVYAWWLAIFPGLMIFLTVLSYNLVGDGLRDATDPRLKI